MKFKIIEILSFIKLMISGHSIDEIKKRTKILKNESIVNNLSKQIIEYADN